jgi:hypothetical protein
MPIDAMDQRLCTISGEDNQLAVALVEHGLFDQQNTKVVTSTIPIAILTQTTKNST